MQQLFATNCTSKQESFTATACFHWDLKYVEVHRFEIQPQKFNRIKIVYTIWGSCLKKTWQVGKVEISSKGAKLDLLKWKGYEQSMFYLLQMALWPNWQSNRSLSILETVFVFSDISIPNFKLVCAKAVLQFILCSKNI